VISPEAKRPAHSPRGPDFFRIIASERELHAQVLADCLLDPVRHRVLFGRVAYFGVGPFLAGGILAAEMSSTVTSIVDDIVTTPASLTPINGD
jgi:hypothetical protein